MWLKICEWLRQLRAKCDSKTATIEDLKVIICVLLFHPNETNITIPKQKKIWKNAFKHYSLGPRLSSIHAPKIKRKNREKQRFLRFISTFRM
jgi:hypothetical protein